MISKARYPLNVLGDFYVVNGMCIMCTAPEHEAPDLMSHDSDAPDGYHCYFKKQPSTADELKRAIKAVAAGCCGAVRYGGTDVMVLSRLEQLGVSDVCDKST